MITFAPKQPSNHSFKRKPVQTKHAPSPQSQNFSPLSTSLSVVQRKANCACGGGCPRCQAFLGIQTKLRIGEPGDKYEQEADRVAEQVMRISEPSLQRQVEPEEEEEIKTQTLASQITPLIQRQAEDDEEEETLQSKTTSDQTSTVPSSLQNCITALKGGGQQNGIRGQLGKSHNFHYTPLYIQRAVTYNGDQVQTDLNPLDPSKVKKICDNPSAPLACTKAFGTSTKKIIPSFSRV